MGFEDSGAGIEGAGRIFGSGIVAKEKCEVLELAVEAFDVLRFGAGGFFFGGDGVS